MPEEAIATLEAPVDTGAETTEVDTTSTEVDSTDETTETTGDDTTATEGTEAETSGESGLIIDGKRLSEAAKATLAEIKAKDPKLASQIKSALFSADALRRALPGGLKEVQTLKQQMDEIGGPEGIQALRTEQQEWNALDEQFVAGDPKFVDNIAEASPEAFQAIAPAAFSKFQQLNPEGYSAYVSQVFVSDMQQEGIPLALERLQDFIGDNPKAMEIWNKLAGYVNRINGFAQKPVNAAAKPNQQPDSRASELDQREANLTRTEWRSASESDRMNVFNGEFARLTAGRKISDTQKAAIKELYVSRLQSALRKSPNFNQNIDRYFSGRDKQGYLRYIGSIYKQEIPKALRSAIDSVLPAKPGPARAATPQAAAAAVPGKPANGFLFMPAQPKPAEVDFTHPFNVQSNWSAGKAVLKDGRKVTWKR